MRVVTAVAKEITNQQLHDLLIAAGYGDAQAAFARQVNLQARQSHGLSLRYDGASVYWWLRGRSPDDPTPQLIADVLARRLGRAVTVGDLGFRSGDEMARLGLAFCESLEDARATVSELWMYQVQRREMLTSVPFVVAATVEAGWRWHFDPRDRDASHRGAVKVTAGDVELLRAYQQQFLDLDRRYGGGHSRTFLADWLHRHVAPMLTGSYTDQVGRQLFAAVAELTGQVAFMSYDIGNHGLAQRHFIQALRLAKAGDNPAFGSHILANMSTQAVYLGRPAEAVRLARAAVDGGRHRAHSSVMARLLTAEACAHAIAGDARSCAEALSGAEEAIERTGGCDGPDWAGYFTHAHLAGTAVRCWRDRGRPDRALRYAEQALSLREGSMRTRTLHKALIGTVYASGTAPDPELASRLGNQALDLAGEVRSRRVADRIVDLARRLRKLPTSAGDVNLFLHRAAEYATTAS